MEDRRERIYAAMLSQYCVHGVVESSFFLFRPAGFLRSHAFRLCWRNRRSCASRESSSESLNAPCWSRYREKVCVLLLRRDTPCLLRHGNGPENILQGVVPHVQVGCNPPRRKHDLDVRNHFLRASTCGTASSGIFFRAKAISVECLTTHRSST